MNQPLCPEHQTLVKHAEKNGRKLTEIHEALLGDMKGQEGLGAKVRRHERLLIGLRRFGWLLVAALIGLGIAYCQQVLGVGYP
jgi:hypothetical protein